jgi:predicted patatin/cPLA2 family phospholipase
MLLLVLEGGGMRAGFVAGALMALMDKRLTGFDVALAVSASVPTLAYFAAGQREEMEKVWREELNTPKLVCYRNIPATSLAPSVKRPILDIDYLVYEVFKQKYPLNLDAVLANRMSCHFAATAVPDAELRFLCPGVGDVYLILKACLAVPGCYPDAVSLDNGDYVDGGTAHPLPVRAILKKRSDRVVAILSKPLDCGSDPPNRVERTLFWRYFRKYDWMIGKLCEAARAYTEEISYLQGLTAQDPPGALIISPERMPPVKFITRDRAKINQTIDMGYRAVEALEGPIRDFMTGQAEIGIEGLHIR